MHVFKIFRTYPRPHSPILTNIQRWIDQRVRSQASGRIVGIYRAIQNHIVPMQNHHPKSIYLSIC